MIAERVETVVQRSERSIRQTDLDAQNTRLQRNVLKHGQPNLLSNFQLFAKISDRGIIYSSQLEKFSMVDEPHDFNEKKFREGEPARGDFGAP